MICKLKWVNQNNGMCPPASTVRLLEAITHSAHTCQFFAPSSLHCKNPHSICLYIILKNFQRKYLNTNKYAQFLSSENSSIVPLGKYLVNHLYNNGIKQHNEIVLDLFSLNYYI
jgi:hypothetical protein